MSLRAAAAANRAQYSRALALYQRGLEQLARSTPGPLHVRLFGGLGNLYRLLGRYREAKPMLERAHRAAMKVFGARAVEICATLNDRAVLCKYTGRFDEGEKLYRQALKLAL